MSKMYENSEVAGLCGRTLATVRAYAGKPENGIGFIGSGRRKIYVWTDSDIDRFRAREVRMGRPPKKTL